MGFWRGNISMITTSFAKWISIMNRALFKSMRTVWTVLAKETNIDVKLTHSCPSIFQYIEILMNFERWLIQNQHTNTKSCPWQSCRPSQVVLDTYETFSFKSFGSWDREADCHGQSQFFGNIDMDIDIDNPCSEHRYMIKNLLTTLYCIVSTVRFIVRNRFCEKWSWESYSDCGKDRGIMKAHANWHNTSETINSHVQKKFSFLK